MATFRVNTAGPSYISEAEDLAAAVAQVRKRLPLRRGWTHHVQEALVARPDGFHQASVVRVVDAAGAARKGHGVVVYALDPMPPEPGAATARRP